MIQIKNLTKVYRTKSHRNFKALKNLNLVLPSKGLVLLCGKSGSGKTTLLNILGGLDYQTEGEILVDGNPLLKKNLDGYRNNYSSFVFQQLNLIDDLTVEENMDVCFDLMGMKKDKAKIVEALSHVRLPDDGTDLDDFLSRRPDELSGGQKQRVAIARGLLKNPRVLILDEPSASLDKENAIVLGKLLKEISKDCLVILSSHNLDVYSDYADMIVRMEQGKIVETRKIGEAIENGEKRIVSDRKGHLSLTSSFKLILRSISRKKVRFFATFFLGILALFCFSFGYQIVSTPTEERLLVSQYENGNKTAFLSGDISYNAADNLIKDKEDVFATYGVKSWNIIDFSKYSLFNYVSDSQSVNSTCASIINNKKAIMIDDSFSYLKRYQKLKPETECRYPVGKREVAISDIAAEILLAAKKIYNPSIKKYYSEEINCVDDLIGLEYNGCRIVGIYTALDNSLNPFLESHPDFITKDIELSERDSILIRGCFMSSYVFVSKDYIQLDEGQILGNVLYELKGNLKDDLDFLNKLCNNSGHEYEVNFYCPSSAFCSRVDAFYSFFDEDLNRLLFFIVVLIVNFLVSLILFYSFIKDLYHSLGILKSIGLSKGGIMILLTLICSGLCIGEYLISLIITSIFDAMVNGLYILFLMFALKVDYAGYLFLLILVSAIITSIAAIIQAVLQKPQRIIDNY